MKKCLLISLVILMLCGTYVAQGQSIDMCTGDGISKKKIGYSEPAPGKIYLLIPVTVENQGYEEFPLSPYQFKLTVDKVKYDSAALSYTMSQAGLVPLESVELQDGGKISGYISFEVPASTTDYELSYDTWAWEDYDVKLRKC